MRPWIALVSVLVGCEAADEPGVSFDPYTLDNDGDGWSDGDEADAGTPGTNPLIHPYPEGGYRTGTAGSPIADCTGPTDLVAAYGSEWAAYQDGDVACNFTLEDSFGQVVDLYAFQGRYVVLSICSAWCPPCQDVAADFAELEEQYAEDVTFIDVMGQDYRGEPADREDVAAWHEEWKLDHVPALADPDFEASWAFERDGYIPTLTLLDREMRVVRSDDYDLWGGDGDWSLLDELVD